MLQVNKIFITILVAVAPALFACSGNDDDTAEDGGTTDPPTVTEQIIGYSCENGDPFADSCLMSLSECFAPSGKCVISKQENNYKVKWENGTTIETATTQTGLATTNAKTTASTNKEVCFSATTDLNLATYESISTITHGEETYSIASNTNGDIRIYCSDETVETITKSEIEKANCKPSETFKNCEEE